MKSRSRESRQQDAGEKGYTVTPLGGPGNSVRPIRWLACLAAGIAMMGMLANACTFPWPLDFSPTPTATATPTIVNERTPTPAPTATPAETAPGKITLTIWSTSAYAPGQATEGARELAQQLEAFSDAYPDYTLDWIVKPSSGTGELVEFLLASQVVAPSVLPDLVVLESRDLGKVVRAGLLQPMGDLFSDEMLGDLFPFARQMGVIEGERYGIPLCASIEHLVYNTAQIDAPPLTWSDVLAEELTYGFPAGGRAGRVNDAFLLQYLAMGGRLVDDAGQPTLDEAALIPVLSFYANGLRAGVLPATLSNLSTPEDALESYIDGEVLMANVTSDLYLANKERLRNTGAAGVPTWNGTVATIGRGRLFAMVTAEESRQLAVKALIDWLLESERLASWTHAAGRLPTSPTTLDLWPAEDNYAAFVRWQLASAYHVPATPEFESIYLNLQHAVREVVTGVASPEEAARKAVAAVQR